VFQFDLHASDIQASAILIDSISGRNPNTAQHLLGPDNKIYIATIEWAGTGIISVID
jgi:hypothetical protein